MTPHLPRLLRDQARRLGPRPALRVRSQGVYHDVSWADLDEIVRCAATELLANEVERGDRVGLLSENRFEWIVADLAILAIGAVTVPLHAPLSRQQVHHQLLDSGAVWVFASTPTQANKIHPVRRELPMLRGITQMEGIGSHKSPLWDAFTQKGRCKLPQYSAQLDRLDATLGPDDLATLMYTSGTTGQPKGVMLTHGNFVSNAEAMHRVFGPFRPETLFFNWLPLSHVYARTADYYHALVGGVTLALAESAETAVANIAELQPTHLSSVPRFYDKILGGIAPESRAAKLRDLFGPNIQWLGCGGAPLPISVGEAFRDAGLRILQGYGLTESSPVISINRLDADKLGTVGQALPGVEIRSADDGEILTRGPHVMRGYWNQPEATAAALIDGWLHTGDLGRLDDEGFLSITGRKKELLVLSNGKKVVPNCVEGLLAAEPLIEQAVVYGEGKPFLSALIVPRWQRVRDELRSTAADEALAVDLAVRDLLAERIAKALAPVSEWEKIKRFVIVASPFSVAREELTVSLKLRRETIFEHHREELEALYR